MDVEVVLGGDLRAAHGADERLLARVHPLVRRQRLGRVEPQLRLADRFLKFRNCESRSIPSNNCDSFGIGTDPPLTSTNTARTGTAASSWCSAVAADAAAAARAVVAERVSPRRPSVGGS